MTGRGELSGERRTTEELALAMELLEHGTLVELQSLGFTTRARDIDEALSRLPRRIVVDPWCGFACASCDDASRHALFARAGKHPELTRAVLEALCARGEFARAGSIIRAAGGVEVGDLVVSHCFDFLNHGFRELVENYVFDDAFKASQVVRTLVSAVLKLLFTPPDRFGRALVDALESLRALEAGTSRGDLTEREHVLWTQARALMGLITSWSTSKTISPSEALTLGAAPVDDALSHTLLNLQAIHANRLDGAYEQAFLLLQRMGPGGEEPTLVSSLAAAEYFVCATIAGRAVRTEERALLHRAIDFLDTQGFLVLSHSVEGYALAVLGLLGEGGLIPPLRDTMERVARHPDSRLRAALRLGLALMLIRNRSLFAAFSITRSLTEDLLCVGAETLALLAYPVETLSRELMGEAVEAPPSVESEAAHPALSCLARLVYAIACSIPSITDHLEEFSFDEMLEEVVPTFAVDVLVELVLESPWDKAGIFRHRLPARWARPGLTARLELADLGLSGLAELFPRLSKRRESRETAILVAEPTAHAQPAPAPRRSRANAKVDPRQPSLFDARATEEEPPAIQFLDAETPLLQLKLLGDFEVIVGDRRIEEDDWRRKAARLMLEILAMVPTHSLTRAELCELIWPDRDFLLSRNNLYSVVSCVRETLGCRDDKPPYLVVEEGRITLNPKLVMVDVDEFEALCKEVLSHAGDRTWRLSLCRHVSALYAGGLRIPTQDVRGDFAAKQRTLHSLYLDVQVEASELALKEGLSKEALWFAQTAREKDPLREDVMACYLRSLAADGRAKEMEDTFESYRQHLARELRVVPSARMEALHHSLARWLKKNERGGYPGELDQRMRSRG